MSLFSQIKIKQEREIEDDFQSEKDSLIIQGEAR